MFSEILKTISLENAPKCDLGFGRLSFTVNVRLPNSKSHFGAAGHVPAGGARWTLLSETVANVIYIANGLRIIMNGDGSANLDAAPPIC